MMVFPRGSGGRWTAKGPYRDWFSIRWKGVSTRSAAYGLSAYRRPYWSWLQVAWLFMAATPR